MTKRNAGSMLPKIAQVIVIITCCAAALLLQSWFMSDLHFHPLLAGGATIAVVLVFAGISYVVLRMARKASQSDDTHSIDPILKAYEESDSKRQLARDYEEWAAGEHSKIARVQMLERMAMALARHGHAFEARMRADQLNELAETDAEHTSVEKFRDELERAIAKMRAEKAADGEGNADADEGTADADGAAAGENDAADMDADADTDADDEAAGAEDSGTSDSMDAVE